MKPFPQTKLEVDSLACVRGGRGIFSDVSFSLQSGQLLAISGPNGAGKSSLLRILAGLLEPASGTFRLLPEEDQTASFHYLGHLDGLKDAMSLRENLAHWARLYAPNSDRSAISDVADRFSLAHAIDLPVGVLSAGQRRRAGLARLTLTSRPVWLLDEPTSALDKEGEGSLGALMSEHLKAGGLIVAATHLKLPVPADLALEMVAP